MKTFFYFIIFFTFFVETLEAHQIEVKSKSPVYTEASSKSSILKEAVAGEKFEVEGRKGIFWQIKTDKGEAFIKVGDSRRIDENSNGIQEALFEAAKANRVKGGGEGVRNRSAVMGVRGLSENSDLGSVGSLRPDFKAVYKMEERIFSKTRIETLEELITQEIEGASNAKKAGAEVKAQ